MGGQHEGCGDFAVSIRSEGFVGTAPTERGGVGCQPLRTKPLSVLDGHVYFCSDCGYENPAYNCVATGHRGTRGRPPALLAAPRPNPTFPQISHLPGTRGEHPGTFREHPGTFREHPGTFR